MTNQADSIDAAEVVRREAVEAVAKAMWEASKASYPERHSWDESGGLTEYRRRLAEAAITAYDSTLTAQRAESTHLVDKTEPRPVSVGDDGGQDARVPSSVESTSGSGADHQNAGAGASPRLNPEAGAAQKLRDVLAYYADEGNYNDDGAPIYENIGPPEGWVGEEFDARVELDEGKAARQALADPPLGRVEREHFEAMRIGYEERINNLVRERGGSGIDATLIESARARIAHLVAVVEGTPEQRVPNQTRRIIDSLFDALAIAPVEQRGGEGCDTCDSTGWVPAKPSLEDEAMEAAWRIAGPKTHRDRATRRKCFDAGWRAALAAHPSLDREADGELRQKYVGVLDQWERQRETLENIAYAQEFSGDEKGALEGCRNAARQALAATPLDRGEPTDERPRDADGRPLCFICRKPQSDHPDGVECAEDEGPGSARIERAAEGHFHAEQFSTALDNPDRMAVPWSDLPDRDKAVRRQIMHFAFTAANTHRSED